jgi:hypothetical protein
VTVPAWIIVPLHPVAADVRRRIALAVEFGPVTTARLASVLAGQRHRVVVVLLSGLACVLLRRGNDRYTEALARAGLDVICIDPLGTASVVRRVAGDSPTTRCPCPSRVPAGAA